MIALLFDLVLLCILLVALAVAAVGTLGLVLGGSAVPEPISSRQTGDRP